MAHTPQLSTLQVQGIDFPSLLQSIDDVVTARLAGLSEALARPEPDSYVTRQEVADFFKITLPTVHAWSNAGILKAYKIGNTTRYLFSEIKAAPLSVSQTAKAAGNE